MPTTTQEHESPEPPPPSAPLSSTGLEDERFSKGLRRQASAILAKKPRASTASEPELLGLMASESSDPQAARDAWGELYRRHARYIEAVVSRAYGARLSGPDRAYDAVADTLQAAFDWSRRQPSPEELVARFHHPDPDRARRRVLGWLAVIARRVGAERVIDAVDRPVQLEGDIPAPEGDDDPPPAELRSLLQGALSKLSGDEVEALRASLPWYEAETRTFAFPRGEAARVAKSLGITTDTLRQRRHRTMKRLKELVRAGV